MRNRQSFAPSHRRCEGLEEAVRYAMSGNRDREVKENPLRLWTD